MNSLTIPLTSSSLTSSQTSTLTAIAKGRTDVIFDLIGIDETSYPVNDVLIDWDDGSDIVRYKRDPISDYRTSSILDEVRYGKIGGSVATRYNHIFDHAFSTTSASLFNIQISAIGVSGYSHIFTTDLWLFSESFYDTLDGLSLLTTQMISLSTNDTVANMESQKSGQTVICVLSS